MYAKTTLQESSFSLALHIISTYKYLTEDVREYIMSKQLLRSGTAVGAMIREAQNAESKNDFIHKLAVAQKECDESLYWLELLKASGYLPEDNGSTIIVETQRDAQHDQKRNTYNEAQISTEPY